MRRILFAIILSLTSILAFAEPDVKLRIGLQAGYNLSKWNGEFKDSLGTKFKNGGHAGVAFELMLNDKWSVQPALMVAIGGTKLDSMPIIGSKTLKDVKVNTIGIKLPVDVMYSIHNVGPGRLVPMLGLYVNGGIGGKTEGIGTFDKESIFYQQWDAKRKAYPDEECTKDWIPDNFDYGMSFKMMYEVLKDPVAGLYAQLGVSRGFTSYQNMEFSLSVGYRFQYVKALRSAYNIGILEYNP
ncbi:MAG: PorT family protein [Paludibacteraceae bacterium]|nr:PorT family protein [Paludibacteraceae bacterium]